MRRPRNLTGEERELWDHVTRSVGPLKRRRRKKPEPAKVDAAPPAEEPIPATLPLAEKRVRKAIVVKPEPPPSPAPQPPLAPIDRHERRQVVRGTRGFDGRIDLHGMRQAEAHSALRSFLFHAQSRGDKLVLVITGKGRAEPHFSFEDERGVLRRVVPQWLRMPDLRPFVVGFEEAHASHGGGGALYVRLRRPRSSEPAS